MTSPHLSPTKGVMLTGQVQGGHSSNFSAAIWPIDGLAEGVLCVRWLHGSTFSICPPGDSWFSERQGCTISEEKENAMGILQSSKRKLLWGILIVSLSAVPVSARASTAGSPEAAEHQDALHEVLPGDNLHLIAGYYYGDARQWTRIWQANRKPIPNPNLIERGMVLYIPDVMIPEEPYPDFVARTRRSYAPTDAPAAAPTKP